MTFNNDFSYGVGNAGIYKYDTSVVNTPKYVLASSNSFTDNKMIWTTFQGIIVLNWLASGSVNVNNFTVSASSITVSGSINNSQSFSGQYYVTSIVDSSTISVA